MGSSPSLLPAYSVRLDVGKYPSSTFLVRTFRLLSGRHHSSLPQQKPVVLRLIPAGSIWGRLLIFSCHHAMVVVTLELWVFFYLMSSPNTRSSIISKGMCEDGVGIFTFFFGGGGEGEEKFSTEEVVCNTLLERVGSSGRASQKSKNGPLGLFSS